MLRDETCFFLAVDFDKEGWSEDAKAFCQTSRELSFPAALERSRSGNGAHVWIFFDGAIPASLARKLGSHILTETMSNEWVRGVCEKPRIKCTECPHQRFLPVTNEAIRWHLSGENDAGEDFIMGIAQAG
jgi:hypothetical protein